MKGGIVLAPDPDPGEGARLAGVLVMRVNVPALKSIGPRSAPVERSAVSATVNW